MIDAYVWTTPNGYKVALMLAETGLAHRLHGVDIGAGAQFDPAFLAIAPNNKIPAIVDDDSGDGGGPLSVFESGAILLYLARKAHRFAGDTLRERVAVKEWLFWQNAGLGPMAGQLGHFTRMAPEPVPYAIERFTGEVARLAKVMNQRLADHRFLAGERFSVADMSSYPWTKALVGLGFDLTGHDALARWLDEIAARPATALAYAAVDALKPPA